MKALLFAAGIAVCAIPAHAALGVSITRGQEAAVRIGMSAAEVRQAIGRPAEIFKFRAAPGQTWSYRLAGAYGTVDFDVEFSSDGRVIAARERATPRG